MKTIRFGFAALAALAFEPAWAGGVREEATLPRSCQREVADRTVKLVVPERALQGQRSTQVRDDKGWAGSAGELDDKERARRQREQEWLKEI